MLDKAIAPKIGRTPFPAFLKNCLLFRSSSSFLFFPLSFMTLSFIAIRIPDFANLKTLIHEKDVEFCTRLSHILALALPPHRISNARSPRQEILYAYAMKGADTIHPTRTFRCLIFCELNLRDSRLEDNVRKRPF